MDPLLIVSPHLDDAVLSCGQLMAGRPDCVVATLCTGEPDTAITTTYDRDSGHRDSGTAMTARRAEDRAALRALHANAEHLGLLDNQYRAGQPFDVADAVEALENVVDDVGPQVVLGPCGLAHPDHVQAAVALSELRARRPDLEVWVYEELPARVLWPEEAPARLDWWRTCGVDPVLAFLGTGPLAAKRAAVRCYTSQLWALDLHACLVPERMWRLWPTWPT